MTTPTVAALGEEKFVALTTFRRSGVPVPTPVWVARDGELLPYLRDVRDHLLLVNEEVSAQRDLLATILEANMAVITVEQTRVSVRQSATMERLTVLATVFLPLTFVTGFFGQNFGWLLGHISGFTAFVFYGIGGMVVPMVLLYLWLRSTRPRPERADAVR